MLALAAIALGALLGYVTSGGLAFLRRATVRHAGAMLVLFGLQSAFRGREWGGQPGRFAVLAWLLIALALAVLLILAQRSSALALVGAGFSMNALVVAANGFMPVHIQSAQDGLGVFYRLANEGTMLRTLADCMVLRLPGASLLISPGDVLLSVGVVIFFVEHAMLDALDVK